MSDDESSSREEQSSVEEVEENSEPNRQFRYSFDVAPMTFATVVNTDYTTWFTNRRSNNFQNTENDCTCTSQVCENVENEIGTPSEPQQPFPENTVSPVVATVAGQRRSIDRFLVQLQPMVERLSFINEETDSIVNIEADYDNRERNNENLFVDKESGEIDKEDTDDDKENSNIDRNDRYDYKKVYQNDKEDREVKDADKENIDTNRERPGFRVPEIDNAYATMDMSMPSTSRQVPRTNRAIPMDVQTLPRLGRPAQVAVAFPQGSSTMNRNKPLQPSRLINNSASYGERLKSSKPPTKPISPKLATKKRAEDRAARQNSGNHASSSTATGSAHAHPVTAPQRANQGARNAKGASTSKHQNGQTKPSRF